MVKGGTTWPAFTHVREPMRRKIDAACRKLARLCIMAEVDLHYVDADGLAVVVDRPKKLARKRKQQKRRPRS